MSATCCQPMTQIHVSGPFARLAAGWTAWRQRVRERADLALMDDRDLRELGLTRAALEYELRRPFWRD